MQYGYPSDVDTNYAPHHPPALNPWFLSVRRVRTVRTVTLMMTYTSAAGGMQWLTRRLQHKRCSRDPGTRAPCELARLLPAVDGVLTSTCCRTLQTLPVHLLARIVRATWDAEQEAWSPLWGDHPGVCLKSAVALTTIVPALHSHLGTRRDWQTAWDRCHRLYSACSRLILITFNLRSLSLDTTSAWKDAERVALLIRAYKPSTPATTMCAEAELQVRRVARSMLLCVLDLGYECYDAAAERDGMEKVGRGHYVAVQSGVFRSQTIELVPHEDEVLRGD